MNGTSSSRRSVSGMRMRFDKVMDMLYWLPRVSGDSTRVALGVDLGATEPRSRKSDARRSEVGVEVDCAADGYLVGGDAEFEEV
jgi:hypothetical protein